MNKPNQEMIHQKKKKKEKKGKLNILLVSSKLLCPVLELTIRTLHSQYDKFRHTFLW